MLQQEGNKSKHEALGTTRERKCLWPVEGFRQDAFSSAVSRGLNASERKVRSMGQLKCEWQIFMDKSKKKNQQNINSFIMVRLQAQGVKKWRWRNNQSCIRSNFRKETLDLSCSIKFYYSHFTAQALRFNFWCHVSCSFTSDFTKRYEVE